MIAIENNRRLLKKFVRNQNSMYGQVNKKRVWSNTER